MISFAALAAAAATITIGGTGTAALVMNAPPTAVDAGTELTAKAHANLDAAEQAHQRALAALATATDKGKSEAYSQIEVGKGRLDQAGSDMRSAVETGSQTAKDAVSAFTQKSVQLMNSLVVTGSATANASVNAGTGTAKAAQARVEAARTAAAAQRAAAQKAVAQAKADASGRIAKAATSRTSVTPGVSHSGSGTQASADAQSSTSTSAEPAGASGSAAGQFGVSVGQG